MECCDSTWKTKAWPFMCWIGLRKHKNGICIFYNFLMLRWCKLLKSLLMEDKDSLILHGQYPGLNCGGIDLVFLDHSSHSTQRLTKLTNAGIILFMHPANERRHCIVTSSLIGWVHTQNDPCCSVVVIQLLWPLSVQKVLVPSSPVWHIALRKLIGT